MVSTTNAVRPEIGISRVTILEAGRFQEADFRQIVSVHRCPKISDVVLMVGGISLVAYQRR